jgi:RNA polymerase sigma factor (sigma-70 family)
MALHFPEGFERIMGYYWERSKFERLRIADKFQKKHPTESLDKPIRIENPGSLETKEVDKKDLIHLERYRRGELEDEEEKLCRKITISQTENKLEDPVDKKIFRGIALEEKTQKEIADMLGVSEPAVSKRIDKIIKEIKKIVD